MSTATEEWEPFTPILAQAMRRLRERTGISQGQLAHRIQPYKARATVNRVETGKGYSEATINEMLRVMGYDGVDLAVEIARVIRELGDTRVKRPGKRTRSPSTHIQLPLARALG